MKHKRYIIGGLIACLALGYLVYVLMGSFMTHYSTVSELKESGKSIYDKSVTVEGEIIHDSIEFDTEELLLTFTIADEYENLEVVYHGTKPNNFDSQTQVYLEGKLDFSGIFQASSILTKCPSKYES